MKQVKMITHWLRRAMRRFAAEAKRDDGVIGIIIILALLAASAALIASSIRQNKDAEVRRLSANSTSVKLLKNSVVSYYLTDADGAGAGTAINGLIPCPDTDFPPDGQSNGTTTCTANTGVVPWLTLGISQDEATDSYGNYFTYAVTGSATSRAICTSVTNSYDSTKTEYTGTLNDVTDTEARTSSQSAGQGAPYYYAFISHGKNGLGAISREGARRTAPTIASEIQNCPSNNSNCTDPSALVIITGPKSTTNSSYFDDTVYLSSSAQLTSMCEDLAPGKGVANAEVNENFTNTAVGALPNSLTASTGTVAVQQSTASGNTTDKVLRFTGANAAITTAVTSFNNAERARYVSFEWRPTTLGTGSTAGVSLGLRATAADRNSTTTVGSFTADIFNTNTSDGLTIRFFEDAASNANGSTVNNIYICDNNTTSCNSAGASRLAVSTGSTLTISQNEAYTVEAYDDGVNVWGRITQVSDNTKTAFATYSAPSNNSDIAKQDLGGNNAIFVVNYSDATVEVDDLTIGRGSLAVNFDGTDDIVETSTSSHGTTGSVSLEAWIRPTSLPSGSNRATLISKWTDGGANTVQAYRLYLTSGGALALQLAGDPGSGATTETHSFGGYSAAAGRWDHIAVTYDGTSEKAAKLYVNRELIATSSSTAFGNNGVQAGSAHFSIGAERDASNIVNEFTGDITDVRVWSTARTAQQVFANYNRRIGLTASSETGLVVNWTLDRDTTAALPTFSSTTADFSLASTAGAQGTLTNNARYVAALQRHFPVFASSAFCASGSAQGTVVGPYECDYRFSAQSVGVDIPNNLPAIYVKAWGAGGGGYDYSTNDSTGGGGGFSAGRISSINSTAIAGTTVLRVDVGGGGAGAPTLNRGAGGGGASGIWLDTNANDVLNPGTEYAGIIGGGGGGASSGDDDQSAASGPNCDTAGNCGPGGGGGGPANISGLTGVSTTRAPDQNIGVCGGRGGDNTTFGSNPPQNTYCASAGTDPTSTSGASGSGAASGGSSVIGAGGNGYNGNNNDPGGEGTGPADEIGAGGGGGGVRVSAMTSGGGEAGGYDGTAIDTDSDVPDDNGSGFGGGGGAGFADSNAIGVIGAAARASISVGNDATAGGATDPDYALSSCNVGTCPTSTPGRGGIAGSTAGQPGAVILKW